MKAVLEIFLNVSKETLVNMDLAVKVQLNTTAEKINKEGDKINTSKWMIVKAQKEILGN